MCENPHQESALMVILVFKWKVSKGKGTATVLKFRKVILYTFKTAYIKNLPNPAVREKTTNYPFKLGCNPLFSALT